MGKSMTSSSCFKLISCGADPANVDDDDNLSSTQSKASSEKRRWSFRKRSARHQVPINTVISEPQFTGYDKENPEATPDKFSSARDSLVPEKKSIIDQAEESTQLSSSVVNSEVTETVDTGKTTTTVTTTIDANIQEYAAVAIQAAIRRFLAESELQKLKTVVKLQAVVRGHLVRRQATGTLRCVQAIIKMQALVRARHGCQLLEKCGAENKLDEKFKMDSEPSTVLMKRKSGIESYKTYPTVEKLLSNRFACQLLESKPKTKPIHISCDPLKPDSSWQWLERWMAATSSKEGQQQDHYPKRGYQEEEENSIGAAYEETDVIPDISSPISSDSKLSPIEAAVAEVETNLITEAYGKFEFQAPVSVPAQYIAKGDMEQYQGKEDLGTNNVNFTETQRAKETQNPVTNQLLNFTEAQRAKETQGPVTNQQLVQLDATPQSAHDNNPNKPGFIMENLKSTTERAASDLTETEGKNIDLGSRKARNTAFAAVQAKFEELSSAPLSSAPKGSKCTNYAYRDTVVEPKPNFSQVESMAKSKELKSTENATTQNPQIASSECGTEISISSTLDSPDRSETEDGEIVLEIGILRGGNHDVNTGSVSPVNLENMKAETEPPSTVCQQQELDDEANESIVAIDKVQVEQQPVESTTSGLQIKQENLKDPHVYMSSPEGSPRSNLTAPESHVMPSKQVSVHTKTTKAAKSNPAQKQKLKSASKSSPSNPKNGSGERSSIEHLPKDVKNAKRRSSFGMPRLDQIDHEPRLSSSSSVPSYMQATESAKAKAHGSASLKSSPDVSEKDNYMKKRHSLPIGDDKQGSSPRVERSASQVQQSSKSSNTPSPHNSAERRWQR